MFFFFWGSWDVMWCEAVSLESKWKSKNKSSKCSIIQETKTFTTVSWFAACLSNKASDKFGKEMNGASTQTATGHGCKQLLTHSYSHLLLKVNMLRCSRQRRSKIAVFFATDRWILTVCLVEVVKQRAGQRARQSELRNRASSATPLSTALLRKSIHPPVWLTTVCLEASSRSPALRSGHLH